MSKRDNVAIIPARSGSKGVPNKNIRLLAGKPLLTYSIAAAINSTLISRVIVSTDSEEYAKIAKGFGAEAPFLRPPEISGDSATDVQFFMHLIDWFRKVEGYVPTQFVHLRPTTPLRDPKVIDEALRLFTGSHYSSLRSVHKMSESSYKTFEIAEGKLKLLSDSGFNIEKANSPRQSFQNTYEANGYVDIVRSELVQKEGMVHGDCVKAFITDVAYEIDELSDLDYINYLIEKNPEIKKRVSYVEKDGCGTFK